MPGETAASSGTMPSGAHSGDDLINDEAVQDALLSVLHGFDPEASWELIRYFHDRLKFNDSFDHDALFTFIAHVFDRLVEKGQPAEAAFGLKKARGERAREDLTERNLAIAAAVILSMRRGNTWEASIDSSAQQFFGADKGVAATRAAYVEYKESLEQCSDRFLESLTAFDFD
ncbi:MAG: hypothetical protein AB7Q81_05130 [Gammaproteobacteria bacterium]